MGVVTLLIVGACEGAAVRATVLDAVQNMCDPPQYFNFTSSLQTSRLQ